MKYIDAQVSSGGEREEVRVPQFSSFAELRKEFSLKQIVQIVNDAIRMKMLMRARAYVGYGRIGNAQKVIWMTEAQGFNQLLFPDHTKFAKTTISLDELSKAENADDLIALLKKAGVKLDTPREV